MQVETLIVTYLKSYETPVLHAEGIALLLIEAAWQAWLNPILWRGLSEERVYFISIQDGSLWQTSSIPNEIHSAEHRRATTGMWDGFMIITMAQARSWHTRTTCLDPFESPVYCMPGPLNHKTEICVNVSAAEAEG